LSDQETAPNEEEKKDSEGSSEASSEASNVIDADSLSDLQELEKIKKELLEEKEKAAKELAEGQEEDEDLREVDYLQHILSYLLLIQQNH